MKREVEKARQKIPLVDFLFKNAAYFFAAILFIGIVAFIIWMGFSFEFI